MGGPAAVNTTRDYIKSATFFANSAITLATFTVGYAGTQVVSAASIRSLCPTLSSRILRARSTAEILSLRFYAPLQSNENNASLLLQNCRDED